MSKKKAASTRELSLSHVLQEIEKRAPSETAEPWDNVGLLVGNPESTTTGAVISIDLTEAALQTAQQRGFRLIVNHHPCLFPRSGGISKVVSGKKGTLNNRIFEAVSRGISVLSCHTNFDQCALEVVEAVSNGLGLKARGRLHEKSSGSTPILKLAVYVPQTHLEKVRASLFEAGAGQIGHYDSCSFVTEGEGTFRGALGTTPFLGEPGELETAKEVKLEVILPRGLKSRVIRAMLASHPYEEVAFDLYSVHQEPLSKGVVQGLGYGFWGEFPQSKPFSEVASHVKRLFNIDGYWMTDPLPKQIKRVAFVAGKGSSFLSSALSLGCDLFITGEAGYHSALQGSGSGMAVMEIGHRESEAFFLKTMKVWLSQMGMETVILDEPTQKIYQANKGADGKKKQQGANK